MKAYWERIRLLEMFVRSPAWFFLRNLHVQNQPSERCNSVRLEEEESFDFCFDRFSIRFIKLFKWNIEFFHSSHSLFYRRKQDEVNTLEDTIRQRSEQQRKAGIELEATCHICLKTKFADGVGHMCHYCNIRCCARCGGKTTIRGKVSAFVDMEMWSKRQKKTKKAEKHDWLKMRRPVVCFHWPIPFLFFFVRRPFGCVFCVAKNRNFYQRLVNGLTRQRKRTVLCVLAV